jgi:hypothetical protein
MTPWEQYLAKKKEKRKAKKQKSKNNPEKEGAPADDDDKPFSDDDLPEGVDLDDPFFQTLDESKPEKTNKKKKDQRKGKKNNKKEVIIQVTLKLTFIMFLDKHSGDPNIIISHLKPFSIPSETNLCHICESSYP